MLGDVICVVGNGLPLPDFSFYKNNPISFVLAKRMPSQAMIEQYGDTKAQNMINPTKKYKPFPTNHTGEQLKNYMKDPPYESVHYPIMPVFGTQATDYLALLKTWGY